MQQKIKKYDAIIIGFGKGGKTLAAYLAGRGEKVAILERSDKMYGGTCINIGCIPTKTLVHQAKSAPVNASWEKKQAYYQKAVHLKNEISATLRQKNYDMLAENPNITVYTGEGSFLSSNIVGVETRKETLYLTSGQIFINTGAKEVIPPVDGVQGNRFVYTSTTLINRTVLPERLVIIGGGYIGMEFASMYASFGSQVTVLENAPDFLPREDRDIAGSIREVLEKKKIVFKTNIHVISVQENKTSASVFYVEGNEKNGRVLEADAVLIATGRKPYTEGLNLDKAGVKTDERGAILVDKHLKTTHPNIWAMGDVTGGLQFTYISLDDFRIIRETLFGDSRRTRTDQPPVSYSVFIDPPLSHIGLHEEEARKQGFDIRVNTIPVSSIPRAKTIGETDGVLKAVIEAKSNRILGCTLFCSESNEVINTVAAAMKTGQDAPFLRDFIFTHPSMSEALNDLFK